MNPRPEWAVAVRVMGTSIDLLPSLKRQVRVSNSAFEADSEEVALPN